MRKIKNFSLSLMGFVFISACSTQQADQGFDYSEADPSIQPPRTSFVENFDFATCLTGGVILGLSVGLLTMDPLSAVAGTAAGCVSLTSIDYLATRIREQYRYRSDQLMSIKNYVEQDILKYVTYNNKVKLLINKERVELARLQQQLRSKTIESTALEDKNRLMQINLASMKATYLQQEFELKQFFRTRELVYEGNGRLQHSMRLSAVEREQIKKLDREIKRLTQEQELLYSMMEEYQEIVTLTSTLNS